MAKSPSGRFQFCLGIAISAWHPPSGFASLILVGLLLSAWLGVELEVESNARNSPRISAPHSRVSAWVIAANKEPMIARHY
jgi:hypothetical protein